MAAETAGDENRASRASPRNSPFASFDAAQAERDWARDWRVPGLALTNQPSPTYPLSQERERGTGGEGRRPLNQFPEHLCTPATAAFFAYTAAAATSIG